MLNQKQIMIEWQKAGLKENGYMFQDIQAMYELAARNADSDEEANKLIILAIRAAAKNGAKSAMAVDNNLKKWLNAGATNAQAVGEYEDEATKIRQPRSHFGKLMRNESPIEKFTPEQIAEQSKRLAKEDGFDDSEEWAKVTMEKFRELRATRAERMADKANRGFTSSGKRVVTRF